MTDKLVIKTWWLLILSLVAGTAIGSLLTAYFGLFSLVAAHWTGGASQIGASILLAGSAYLLCEHRDDLIDD